MPVDAEQADSLRQFFAQAGRISDLVITVTRRDEAGLPRSLAEADLLGAFAGKTVAHLPAVALALATLADDGRRAPGPARPTKRQLAGGWVGDAGLGG